MVDAAFEAAASQTRPPDADPFRAGDFVVYPTHGVGKVERVGVEEFAGHQLEMVRVCFAENRMTLSIPLAQARAAGLRKIATAAALAEAMHTLEGRPRVNRMLWAKRAQGYLAKINSGDLGSLAEVVRDLQTAADGSGSSFSQRNLFELAIERFAGESAAIEGANRATTIERLTQRLQQGRRGAVAPADCAAESGAG